MGMFNTEKCPLCENDTSVWQKSGVKVEGRYLCKSCHEKLLSTGVSSAGIKSHDIETLKEILSGKKKTDDLSQHDLQTAEGMYLFCVNNDLTHALIESSGIKFFKLVENSLSEDEKVLFPFIARQMDNPDAKSNPDIAYALTNKRLILARKLIIGETLQTISLDHINNITLNSGVIDSVIVIDTLKEKIKMKTIPSAGKKIYSKLQEELGNLQKNSHNENHKTESSSTSIGGSVADEIKKYKELLDMGAITQEEFDEKKRKLLDM